MSGLLLVFDCVPWWRKLVPAHWQAHCLVTWGMYQLKGPFPRDRAGGTSILSKTPKKKQTSWRRKILRKRKTKNVQQPVRRGSRINTDWFPKWAPKVQASCGVWGRVPPGNVFDFYSSCLLPCGSESFRQDIGQILTWTVFLLLQYYLFWKNVTHFRKTVATGVDPGLPVASHWKLFTPFESDNLMKRLLQATTT